MEDAYKILASNKLPEESFSDVIRRITPKKDISRFFGAWDISDEEAEKIKKTIYDNRKQSHKAFLKKVKNL